MLIAMAPKRMSMSSSSGMQSIESHSPASPALTGAHGSHIHGDGLTDAAARSAARSKGIYSESDRLVYFLWDTAPEWAHILQLNRAYLRGQHELTPYYMGPIHGETLPMVPGLLALHDYGLMTYQSQPAAFLEAHETKCSCGNDPPWLEERQRAFVTFLLPKGECDCETVDDTTINKFLDELMGDANFYTAVISYDGTCRLGGCKKNIKLRNNFPEASEWATHKRKRGDSKELLEDSEYEYPQIFEIDCPCALRSMNSRSTVIGHMSPYMVHVLAKSWDEVDIPGLVKAAAERAGLEPLFAADWELPPLEQIKNDLVGDDDEDGNEDGDGDDIDVPNLENLKFGDEDAGVKIGKEDDNSSLD